MIFAILVLIVALALAGTAAWFSIFGLIAIFAASPISVAIMASGLEAAKLVSASWLYRNWDNAPLKLKAPLTIMTIIMMFITSLGIFGFLSKAHIEQGAPVGNNQAKIERIEQKIQREQRKIQDAEAVIQQLDDAVNTLIEYDRIRGPSGSIAVRESQKEEREALSNIIDNAQAKIDQLTDEKFALETEVRNFEVEVGPIKYVADILYEESSQKTLEKAVRWLIFMIIFVFDPFAVLLLIAANYSLMQTKLKNRLFPVMQTAKQNEELKAKTEEMSSPDEISEPEEIPESAEVKEEKPIDQQPEENNSKENINNNSEEKTIDYTSDDVYNKAKSNDELAKTHAEPGIRGRLINQHNKEP